MREKEKTTKLDETTLKLLRQRIRAVDGILSVGQEVAEAGDLWTFKVPSMLTGLEKIEAAAQEIQKSISAQALGTPYTEDTQKGEPTRQTKKKTTKKRTKRK